MAKKIIKSVKARKRIRRKIKSVPSPRSGVTKRVISSKSKSRTKNHDSKDKPPKTLTPRNEDVVLLKSRKIANRKVQKGVKTDHLNPWKWKKGQSGNPKGRPKGTISLTTQLRRLLEQNVVVRESGKRKNTTTGEVLLMLAIDAAKKGKFSFFKEIYDRIDGKVSDKLIVSTTKKMVIEELSQISTKLVNIVFELCSKYITNRKKADKFVNELADQLDTILKDYEKQIGVEDIGVAELLLSSGKTK